MRELFEKFCSEYNLEYDFTYLGNNQYANKETQEAFICFKSSILKLCPYLER